MKSATSILDLSDETFAEIERSLDVKLSNTRRKLFKRILGEWIGFILPDHLSREPLPIKRHRLARTLNVKKCALRLSNLLSKLDDMDRFAVAHLIEIQYGQSRSEIERQRKRLMDGSRFIDDLSAIAPQELWRLSGRPRTRTLVSYLVLSDAAAMFEWLTGAQATRVVDRITNSESGGFYWFASFLWPIVFGNQHGLQSAIKNWAAWRKRFGERSPLIANIALRHPEWRLSERKSIKSSM
jgi:hypothetical protein